jgi:hypothetical protein
MSQETSAFDPGCVKTQKIEKRRERFFSGARNLTPLRLFVPLKEDLRNFYSIASARLGVFTQPRPIAAMGGQNLL